MAWGRWLGVARWGPASALVALVVLAPAVASVVDRGAEGRFRLTPFYLALTLSDDSARESIRHSLALAASVAILSAGVGVALGKFAAGGPSTPRDAMAALARAPGAYPPLFAALGCVGAAAWSAPLAGGAWRWIALGWVELAWGTARVMAASERAFARVRPSWIDAARMAGAGRRRAFWSVAWPLARAPVARAVAEVFALVLFEPSGPLILGLRRTLSYQIVDSAFSPDRLHRAAALTMIGLLLAAVVRAPIRAWGGPVLPVGDDERPPTRPASRASWLAATALGLWALFALLPLVGLVLSALDIDRSARVRLDAFAALLRDGEARAALGHGLVLGIGATGLATLVAWGLGARDDRPAWRSPGAWAGGLPPVIAGLSVLLLPDLLNGLATLPALKVGLVARGLHGLARLFDPFASPWIALIVATAVPRIGDLRAAIGEAGRQEDRSGAEVARTLGARRLSAWVEANGPGLAAVLVAALAASFSASAIDSAPALLVSPTREARPIAPSLRTIASEPSGLRRASALALVALLIPVGAWIVGGARDSAPRCLERR